MLVSRRNESMAEAASWNVMDEKLVSSFVDNGCSPDSGQRRPLYGGIAASFTAVLVQGARNICGTVKIP